MLCGVIPIDARGLPWPADPSGPRCAASVSTGVTTGPVGCLNRPAASVLVHYIHNRTTWRAFLCLHHAAQVSSAEPLTPTTRAELRHRHEQYRLAMAGEPYTPTEPVT